MNVYIILLLYLLSANKVNDIPQRCIAIEEKLNEFIWSETLITDDAASIAYEAIHINCPCKMQAYNVAGFLGYNKSKYNEAERFLYKAEKLFYEDKGNTKYMSLNQNYIALLEIAKKDFESALFHLKKSKELAESIQDSLLISFVNLNLGLVQFERGELDLAEQFWLKALEVKNIDNKIRENDGYAYQNLARVYSKKKAFEKSLQYVEKAKRIWLKLDYKKGLYLLSLSEARTLIDKKKFHKALIQLEKGKAYSDEAGIALLKGEYYFLESQIHQKLSNETNEIASLKEALNYSVELSLENIEIILNRLTELFNREDSTNINKLFLTAFKRLKDQNEINSEKKLSNEKNLLVEIGKKEKGETTIKRQTIFIDLLVLFSIVLFSLILWIFKQNATTNKLNQKLLTSHKIIRRQINQLKLRNKELQNFAYEASHDLKSPLRTITSFTELLEKKIDQQDDTEKKYILYIKKSTNNMIEMITNLLNHSTSEKGIELEEIEVVDLIEQAINNLQTDITNSQAKVFYQKDNKAVLWCDKNKFIQLFQNLIGNAINYAKETEKPIIKISTEIKPNSFVLKVKDNGIGIDEKNHKIIFEMFKRLKVKPNTEGTGIGLATCKKIVELHKGKISLQSKINQGSLFEIVLPINLQNKPNNNNDAFKRERQLSLA